MLMLSPLEEQRDLHTHPLPVDMEDRLIPTQVAGIDREIIELTERLNDLRSTRISLLNRALEIGVTEDQRFRIVIRIIKGDRQASAEMLRMKDPEKWKKYTERYQEDARRNADDVLQKAMDNENTKVILSIADRVFGKDVVTECSVTKDTKVVEVEAKE